MPVSAKEKELAAVGLSVAAGCRPCTDHHVTVARKARATDDEIRAAVADAIAVRNQATGIMHAHALSHFGMAAAPNVVDALERAERIRAYVRLGAAFAVNCTSSLEHALAAAGRSGITVDDITQVCELAGFIRGRAKAHVEDLAKTGAAAGV